jgi:hypothetical protein
MSGTAVVQRNEGSAGSGKGTGGKRAREGEGEREEEEREGNSERTEGGWRAEDGTRVSCQKVD